MVSLFAPPVLASDDLSQRARVFHFVVWMTMLFSSGFQAVVVVQQATPISRSAVALVFILSLGFALLELNRRGRTRLASILYVGGIVLLVTGMALTAEGIRAPGITTYVVMALTASLLLGERAGIATAIVCAALGLGLALLEELGMLPPHAVEFSATAVWLLNCLYIAVVIVLMRLITQMVTDALRRAETELSERRRIEQQRERAEKELQENQTLLRTMIENTPAAVAMFDTEMRYIAYSKRWLSDYRLGIRDIKGLSHYAVF